MRHPSPPDDHLPPDNPSPPRWTYGVGLASPSSGTEVIYESPEEYEEEDVPELIYSPETKKRRDAEDKRRDEEFKREIDEMTSESDEFDPTGKTPEQMDAMIAKYHMDCHNSRMEAIRRRDLLQGTCRSCTLPHLYSPGVCPAFAGVDPAPHVPHVPRQIRPAEDWSVLVSGDGDPDVSRYNELERKRAAREYGPVKSVPQLRLCGPIRPAGPIPPLDTKLLVTSKVFLLLS